MATIQFTYKMHGYGYVMCPYSFETPEGSGAGTGIYIGGGLINATGSATAANTFEYIGCCGHSESLYDELFHSGDGAGDGDGRGFMDCTNGYDPI